MTQYSTLNVKLSNSQLNKLKSAMKNGTEITLNLLNLGELIAAILQILFLAGKEALSK